MSDLILKFEKAKLKDGPCNLCGKRGKLIMAAKHPVHLDFSYKVCSDKCAEIMNNSPGIKQLVEKHTTILQQRKDQEKAEKRKADQDAKSDQPKKTKAKKEETAKKVESAHKPKSTTKKKTTKKTGK